MANLAVKNAADTTVYLSTQGAGTNSDPYIYTGGSMVVSNFPATQAVSAASLPLPSGAATLAKQPALGTAGVSSTDVITVQGIASGTAQPISAASLPLPSGASTALKQPALGTAGTASADVITIQGIASMTAVKVDGSAVTQPTSNATQLPAALGQTTMSASLPVVIASNQSAVPVSGTVTANLGSGSQVSVSGAVAVTQSGTWTVQPGNTANTTAWVVRQSAVSGSAVTPAAATAAVYTWGSAGGGLAHIIDYLAWSYNGTPVGGNLMIQDGSTTVFSVDITAGGPGFIPVYIKGTANTAMTITLSSGSTGITGKLNFIGKRTE